MVSGRLGGFRFISRMGRIEGGFTRGFGGFGDFGIREFESCCFRSSFGYVFGRLRYRVGVVVAVVVDLLRAFGFVVGAVAYARLRVFVGEVAGRAFGRLGDFVVVGVGV